MADTPLIFVVPGSLDQRTGGTIYDRRIIDELRKADRKVQVAALPGSFPFCDTIATQAARKVLQEARDGAILVIDGLALPAFAPALPEHPARLNLTALIHHPLARETGLSSADQQELFDMECALLRQMPWVITTSPATAEMLYAYNVDAERIAVVPPGTDPAPLNARPNGRTIRLLCVASLIARKGHAALIEALASCTDLEWRLDCYGALDRDLAISASARALVRRVGLENRIIFHGEADDATLSAAYAAADVFVLASSLEGYGMAFAEALAHGLPVVGSGAGAVRDTVPETAGLIVSVGDGAALSKALTRVIDDSTLRTALAAGACAAARRLPDWPRAGRAFAVALERSRLPAL